MEITMGAVATLIGLAFYIRTIYKMVTN